MAKHLPQGRTHLTIMCSSFYRAVSVTCALNHVPLHQYCYQTTTRCVWAALRHKSKDLQKNKNSVVLPSSVQVAAYSSTVLDCLCPRPGTQRLHLLARRQQALQDLLRHQKAPLQPLLLRNFQLLIPHTAMQSARVRPDLPKRF